MAAGRGRGPGTVDSGGSVRRGAAGSAPATAFVHDSLREGFLGPSCCWRWSCRSFRRFRRWWSRCADITRSLIRLPSAGRLDRTAADSADAADQQVDLEIRPAELKTLTITSEQDLTIHLVQYGIINEAKEGKIVLTAGEPWKW